MSFDRLRTTFAYGVLYYDIFTLVNDHALLVLEQAPRDGSSTTTRARSGSWKGRPSTS